MKKKHQYGFGIIEIIVAMAIMISMATAIVSTVIYSFTVNRLASDQTQATLFAQEGIEAVRSIKNQSWNNLTTGTFGLSKANNFWKFLGTSDTNGKFTRQVTVSTVQRDGSNNIVASGGTVDTDTMLATCSAVWNSSPTRSNAVTLTSYFTNFRKTACSWTTATLKGTFNKGGNGDPYDIVTDGTYAYMTTISQGGVDKEFFIFNVTNPNTPTQTGSLEIGLDVKGIAIQGNYAYLATGGNASELIVVDISNKSSPSIVGTPLNIGANQDATDVFVDGNYAYVAKVVGSGSNREFYIIDITNPLLPVQVGSYETGATVNAVMVSGNYAYLATTDNAKELEIVNITNKTAPVQAGTFNAIGNADGQSLFVSGSTVYLGRLTSSDPDFFILDVGSPSSISQIGSFEVGGSVNEIQVNDTDAFLATDVTGGQFRVLNISTPASPTLKSSLNLNGTPIGLVFDSTNCAAYVGNNHNTQELQIIQP